MPATSEIMAGCAAGLYKNTGTYGTPVWVEITIVKDVKPAFPWDFAEALSRETPVKLYAKTQVDVPLQVVMRADPASVDYALWVEVAGERATYMDLLVLNTKIGVIGGCGVRGPYLLSLTEEPETINETIYSTFDLKPTLDVAGHVPVWALVTDDDDDPLLAFVAIHY